MRLSTRRRIYPSLALTGLVSLAACGTRVVSAEKGPAEEVGSPEADAQPMRSGQIWRPDEGDRLWVFAASKDELGSGGEFHIYVDPETHPDARASFAKFSLGVGGALPEHRHDKSEEIAYFISGEGVVKTMREGQFEEISVGPGYVWYNPPGVWHAVTNTGSEPLAMVFATIPNEKKGLLSFFRKISVKPGEDPATTLSPEEFGRIATEHDMILRPPEEP